MHQLSLFVTAALETLSKPAVLIGDCFGATLALYLASQPASKTRISHTVLINPATSFSRTAWRSLVPLILNAGPAFPVLGLTALSTMVQREQWTRIGGGLIRDALSAPDPRLEISRLIYTGRGFMNMLTLATIKWRLDRWMDNGSKVMSARLGLVTTPVLLLVGKEDQMLPSHTEGYRLEKMLNKAAVEVKEFDAGGHVLLDDALDLFAVMNSSHTLGPPPSPISVDIPFPSDEEIEQTERILLRQYASVFSPVFITRSLSGDLVKGIDSLPIGREMGRPVLLVGNHQLLGLDSSLLVREFVLQRRTLVRGLGHPMIFSGDAVRLPFIPEEQEGVKLFAPETFRKLGVVEVSPASIFQLMQRNETILLYPGGGLELFHDKGEAYQLKWTKQTDFIRMAASFNAIVIPFGAVGIEESLNMVLDGKEIRELPYFGTRAKR